MNNRLMIMSDADRRGLSIFYRDKYRPAVSQTCQWDLAILIARLGGEAPDPNERLYFHYSDVVGIVQKMVDDKMITATGPAGDKLAASFQIQSLPGLDDPILSAPSIQEQRPQDVPATQNVARAMGN